MKIYKMTLEERVIKMEREQGEMLNRLDKMRKEADEMNERIKNLEIKQHDREEYEMEQ